MGDVPGYARVPTGDQDAAGQELRLRQAGAIKVFTDVRRWCGEPGWLAQLRLGRYTSGVPFRRHAARRHRIPKARYRAPLRSSGDDGLAVGCAAGRVRVAVGRGAWFKGRQFTAGVILRAVRWCLLFPTSCSDLELMLQDRGVHVDHTTVFR